MNSANSMVLLPVNKNPIIILLLALAIHCLFLEILCASDDDSKIIPINSEDINIWKTCQQQNITSELLLKANEKCISIANSFDDAPKKNKKRIIKKLSKNMCFRACQLQQLGWVDNNDVDEKYQIFNQSQALSSITDIFPSDIHVRLQYGILQCSKSEDAENLSTKANCRSYTPLVKCIDKVIRKNCKRTPRSTTIPTTTMTSIFTDDDESTTEATRDDSMDYSTIRQPTTRATTTWPTPTNATTRTPPTSGATTTRPTTTEREVTVTGTDMDVADHEMTTENIGSDNGETDGTTSGVTDELSSEERNQAGGDRGPEQNDNDSSNEEMSEDEDTNAKEMASSEVSDSDYKSEAGD